MEPMRSSGYYDFLKDPDLAHPFDEAATQGDFSQPSEDFPYAHGQFPLFSTQPPPAVAVNGGRTAATRSRVRQRVQANPAGQDDGRGRMYYTQDEDLRLVRIFGLI
jgi:hypothetical protein